MPAGVGYPSSATPNVELVPPSQCGPSHPGTPCVVNTTYSVFGPSFADVPWEATIAQSAYNSLQVNLQHTSKLSSFLIGYTYSKCMDNASGLQEGVNPFDPKLSIGLCIFDVTQNFVASYETQLPFDRAFHTTSGWANRLAEGWSVSGITSFVTNPRNGSTYFNTSLFSPEALGTIGNSRRRFFHGPGLNNWNIALLKDTKLTESKFLQFRAEAFNVFNHAQFSAQNSSGFGTVASSGFGIISATYGQPRVLQVGLKLLF